MFTIDLTEVGKSYGEYTPILERDFSEKELKYFVETAEISQGDYDVNVKIGIAGTRTYKYFTLSNHSNLNVGDTIPTKDLKLLALKKDPNNEKEVPCIRIIEK